MKSSLKPIAIPGQDGKFSLPEDGFIQFLPLGEYSGEVDFGAEKPEGVEGAVCGPDGRWSLPIIQVLDADALTACLASYKPDALVDYEHRSNQPDGDSSAGGWTENAEARADGLYCRIRWSAKGLADVTGGNYRFLSPVFPWPSLEHISGSRYRPRSFDGAALTNVPNLKNIRAVSNRGNPNHAQDGKFAEGGGSPSGGPSTEHQKKLSDLFDQSSKPGNEQVVVPLAKVDDASAARIKKETGLDVVGYEHAMDNYALRHIMAEHGDPEKELARGQLPITREDLLRLPEITAQPDNIAPAGKTKLGRDGIAYTKKFPDGSTYLVEEVRTGKKKLVPVTMRKTKNGATSDGGKASNSYVRNASPTFLAAADEIADRWNEDTPAAGAVKNPLSPRAGNAGTAPEQAGQKNTPSTAGKPASDGKERNMLEQLIKELNLPPGSTEDDVLKALGAMKTKLADVDQQALAAQVENDLKTYGGRVQNREALKTALLKDRAGTLATLQLMKPEPPPARALNAATGKTPPEADVTTKGDRARGAKIANRAKELRKAGASRQDAFRKAEAELSEK